MKTKLFILSFVLLSAIGTLSAHVWTVSNNAISAGHFTVIQKAADSAAFGDTIYVMGSPTDYGSVTLKTKVTLIGAGYAVTGTQNNWNSIVDYVYLDTVSGGNQISGTKIMGLYINSNIQESGGPFQPINYIDIERCYIGSYIYVSGSYWTIRNNDISTINMEPNGVYAANVFIQNNFIYSINYSNQTTVLIDHNIFATNNGNAFYGISNALISNNIFYFSNPSNYVSTCTFSNNLTTASSTINLNTLAGNTGSNNIFAFAASTGWTDATIPASTVSQNAIWNYKWTLKAASVGSGKATDATDIGIYGGSYPMPNLTGATRIPQMTLMNVGAVVPAGGNMNVNFKARIQN